MFGLDLVTAAGLLILAGNTAQCIVPQPPKININPVSAPIAYEFSLSSADLGKMKNDTVNPYAAGVDVTTGGLRHDRPVIRTAVEWGTMISPYRRTGCMWYNAITVTIELNPKIYIAREHEKNKTCRQAILEHEIRHVETDRAVMNQYALAIGTAVKQSVDSVGAMGPYNESELPSVQKRLVAHIQAAVDSQQLLLDQEMQRRQSLVDSLEEYERVSRICGSSP